MGDHTNLNGATAIVTGASKGIGRAIATTLASSGANVSLASRSESSLQQLAMTLSEEYDSHSLAVPTNVRNEDAVEELVKETKSELGSIDIFVNNAGMERAHGKPVDDVTTGEYMAMIETNVNGMFFTARAALPHLRESSGNLVFIGSFAGQYPRPASPIYAATKWWTRGFALSVEAEAGSDEVSVTVINPSEVRTEWIATEGADSMKDRFDPGEITEPQEVAEAVLFAVTQRPPNTVSELNLYRRDKMSHF